MAEGQREIILPPRPVRPDCVWIVVCGIHLDDCEAEDRQVQLSLAGTGYDVRAVYIEAAETPDTQAGVDQE